MRNYFVINFKSILDRYRSCLPISISKSFQTLSNSPIYFTVVGIKSWKGYYSIEMFSCDRRRSNEHNLLRKGLLKSRTRGRETKIKYPLKSGQDFTVRGTVAISLSGGNVGPGKKKIEGGREERGRLSHRDSTRIQPYSPESTFFHALATECKSNRRGNLKSARSCWRTCKLVRERRRHRRQRQRRAALMRFHVDERAVDERGINGIVESTVRGFIDPFPAAPETTSQLMFYRNVSRETTVMPARFSFIIFRWTIHRLMTNTRSCVRDRFPKRSVANVICIVADKRADIDAPR